MLNQSIVHQSESNLQKQDTLLPSKYLSHLESQDNNYISLQNQKEIEPIQSQSIPKPEIAHDTEAPKAKTPEEIEKDRYIEQLEKERAELNQRIKEEQEIKEALR